jgi:SNF2 family DNA or RNA helicase
MEAFSFDDFDDIVAETVEPTVDWLEAEVDKQADMANPPVEIVSVTIVSDPREEELLELIKKVDALRAKVDHFDSEVTNPLQSELTKIHSEQEHSRKVFQQLMDELNKQYAERQRELYRARDERRTLQFELDRMQREHSNLLKSMQTEKVLKEIEDKIDMLIVSAPWGMDARSYQLIDLKYMLAAFETGKSGVLNANDMGLGKTFESIMLDYCLQHLFPAKYDRMPLVLWVTTPSLIKQTVREIKRWNPGRKVIPVEGSWNRQAREWATTMAIDELALVVVNYEQMNTNDVLMNTKWDVIFADEVSKLKGGANPKPTKVWENMRGLLWELDAKGNYKDPYDPTPRAKFFVPLSGTPIQNKPGDMWAYLHLFMPNKFPKLKNFEREYAYGWPEIKVNFERMINVMSDQVIRRSKKDELKDLPDKIRELRECDMTTNQRKLYEEMRDNFFTWLDTKNEAPLKASVVIEWIIRLWELALDPSIIKIFDAEMNEIPTECKESGVIDEAMEILEQELAGGEKVVVWSSWFNQPLFTMKDRIEKELGVKCALYTGEQSTTQRDDAVVSFQSEDEGSVQVLLCNMKAAGYGLNLQNSSVAIFLDRWWNPAVQVQAEDRQHRMGQKNSVTIHQMHATDSVYDFIKSKFDSKEEMAESIMESKKFRKSSDWKRDLEGLI